MRLALLIAFMFVAGAALTATGLYLAGWPR